MLFYDTLFIYKLKHQRETAETLSSWQINQFMWNSHTPLLIREDFFKVAVLSIK